MNVYETEGRGYFRFTTSDLISIQQQNCKKIIFNITGEGSKWEYGAGSLIIHKDSDGWLYLIEQLANLPCFHNYGCYSSSKSIPVALRQYFYNKKQQAA